MKPNQKAIVLAGIGYLVGVLGQMILFPLFGLGTLPIGTALVLGVLFTTLAYLGNLFGLWLITSIESNKATEKE